MRNRILIQVGILEALALTLGNLQTFNGVRTDEAKYLLDIPYPHAFLGRGILHLFEWLPDPETFWRMILASLLIQCFWLVWDLGRDLSHRDRTALSVTWICSAAVLMQAGTIMMAPLTAIQALILVWLESRAHFPHGQKSTPTVKKTEAMRSTGIAFFWLASLFTAHQILLFTPILWSVLTRLRRPLPEKLLYVFGPIVALVLYVFAHPLLVAIFVTHAGKDASLPFLTRIIGVAWLWIIAGSLLGTVPAVIGLFRGTSVGVKISAILLTLACIVSSFPYYAILFVPLVIAGLHNAKRFLPLHRIPYIPFLVTASLVLIGFSKPWFTANSTRQVTAMINQRAGTGGEVLIHGDFGHDWQYENTRIVRRFVTAELPKANAVVCMQTCRDVALPGFAIVEKMPKTFTGELWIRPVPPKKPVH